MSKSHLRAVVGDIGAAGNLFLDRAADYSEGMPYDGAECPFGCPRGGTELIDRVLENTLRLIGEVHVEIGQAMANHGHKLRLAAEQYASAEEQAHAIIGKVFQAAKEASLPPDQPHE